METIRKIKLEVYNNYAKVSKDDDYSYSVAKSYFSLPREIRKKVHGQWVTRKEIFRLYEINKDGDIIIPRGLVELMPPGYADFVYKELITLAHKDLSDITDNTIATILQPESGFDLRSDQVTAIRKAFLLRRGILQLATGAGKTEIMAGMLKLLNQIYGYYPKSIIVEPTLHLVNDTVKRLAKYDIPATSYTKHRDVNKSDVILTHPMSLTNDVLKDPDLLKDVQAVFFDECLPKGTRILLEDNQWTTLQEVYENDNITQVMSYNLALDIYEVKPIIRKVKTEAEEYFWKVYYIDPVSGKKKGISATPNHKIWTRNRGYVRVDELIVGDVIKINTSEPQRVHICRYCGKQYLNSKAYAGHINSKHVNTDNLKNYVLTHGSPFSDPEVFKKAMKSRSANTNYREYLSRRMLENNPAKKDSVRRKISKSIKLLRETNPEYKRKCLTNFKNAPRRGNGRYDKGMTRLEKFVDRLRIPGLKYTGNGTHWIDLNGRNKNPDFTYSDCEGLKFIEVGDIEYWHTKEEIKSTLELYESCGYKCLYLTNEDIDNDPEEAIGRIEKFLFNHHVEVVSIRKKVGKKPQYKYNLEVADNHNYFADNVLVSNCHHLKADTWFNLMKSMSSIQYSIGLSASVVSPSRVGVNDLKQYTIGEALAIGGSGRLLLNIPPSYYIRKGILATPVVFQLHNPANEPCEDETKWHQKVKYRLESPARSGLALQTAGFMAALGRKSLIFVSTKTHAKRLMEVMTNMGFDCRASFGGGTYLKWDTVEGKSVKVTDTEDSMEKFKTGEFKILIATSHLLEGADVPNLDCIIILDGGKKLRKMIQEVGRGIRKTKTGKYAYLIDFTDHGDRVLDRHAQERLYLYRELIQVPDELIHTGISFPQLKKFFLELEGIEL